MRLVDIEGTRTVTVTSIGNSVFVEGENGVCFEYDRYEFVAAFKVEFNLVTEWDTRKLMAV